MSSKTLTLYNNILGTDFKTLKELLEKLTIYEKFALIAEMLKP